MIHPLKPVRVTAPAEQVVSLSEAKAHLRVDHDDEDTLISAMVAAAITHLDGWSGVLGRCLVAQDWRQAFARFPGTRKLRLPMPDVSVVSVAYVDSAGIDHALESLAYMLIEDHLGPFIYLADASWPETAVRPDAVTVTFTAGYGPAATDVPAPIRAAILLMIGDLYRNRETTGIGSGAAGVIPMSTTVEALIAPFRRRII